MKELVLASQSPRRYSLLQQFGMPFDVIVANVDETPRKHENAADMTLRLAQLKADSVFSKLADKPHYRVLGSDTTVVMDGVIMGKPVDKEDAVAMLQKLSGKTHRVLSAVALVEQQGCRALLSESKVTFKSLSLQTILRYCDSADPYDKAGGYGIQSGAGKFVTHIEGSYSGIMGLPLWHTHQLLIGEV